jgi:hypothetical protein
VDTRVKGAKLLLESPGIYMEPKHPLPRPLMVKDIGKHFSPGDYFSSIHASQPPSAKFFIF